MINPAAYGGALAWLLAVAALAGVFLIWSARKLRAGLVRRRERRRRALLEDLLKHVFTQRHEGLEATVDSVAGHLGLSPHKAPGVIMKAESAGLLRSEAGRLRLTEEGERWALQVVRAHRLWETWLANEARVPVSDLHKPAEREEHRLTGSRLEELDAYLGHPRRDPHGDPIPTASGEIPAQKAMPLTNWPAGRPAEIAHVEDEPEAVFRTITGYGLRPGSTIRITRQLADHLTVTDGEKEYDLPPLVAGNIQVVPVSGAVAAGEPLVRLSDLQPGEEAEVIRLDQDLRGFTRRRLLDLGLTPNSRIAARLVNAFGDPMAFRVRGTTIALRKDQAARIWVRKAQNAAEARTP